jgi:DNA-damage-inducible protein J
MSSSMRDENGFTPAQAAELQKRIDEIEQGNVVRHDYTRVPY